MKNTSPARADNRWQRFLWWLATAEKELLAGALVDQNRYAIVGYTVLGTWAFATLAWTYFFSTVGTSLPAATGLGAFMGGIILCIDRALIKGIHPGNRRRWLPLLFRGLLALTIGAFMAQPALLYLFRKEIQLQTATDNQQRLLAQTALTDSFYAPQRAEAQQRKLQWEKRLDSLGNLVNAARERFLAEADGSGGTGRIGISTIALAKKQEYQQLEQAFATEQTRLLPLISNADSALRALETRRQTDLQSYSAYFNDGFLTRIEALQHLLAKHPALQVRYYLLLGILLLIELMPVIAKTLLPPGVYEERVKLREEMERQLAAANTRRETALMEFKNQQAFEHDQTTVKEIFTASAGSRKTAIQEDIARHVAGTPRSFNTWWGKMKSEWLAGQTYD